MEEMYRESTIDSGDNKFFPTSWPKPIDSRNDSYYMDSLWYFERK